MKKKKTLIILLTIGIAVSMGISIYTTKLVRNGSIGASNVKTQLGKPDDVKTVGKDEVVKSDKDDSIIGKTTPPNSKDPLKDYTAPSKADSPNISSLEAKNFESETRELFRQFKFKEGTTILSGAVNKYTLGENGKVIERLYYESSLIMALDGADDLGIINIIQGIKDPENLLIAVLHLDDITRQPAILNKESLNPIFSGNVTIRSNEIDEDSYSKRVKQSFPGASGMRKIMFDLEGNALNAYILEYPDGSLTFYAIQSAEGATNQYKTITQWQEILKTKK